jgi:hypothetical protein
MESEFLCFYYCFCDVHTRRKLFDEAPSGQYLIEPLVVTLAFEILLLME